MAGIALDRVSKKFGTVEVIQDLSLEIGAGEFVVFLGPSGSGKTTLLRMIAGLESIDNGALTIDQAPCEAYAVTCGVTFTFGGVKVNNEGNVEDTAGKTDAVS